MSPGSSAAARSSGLMIVPSSRLHLPPTRFYVIYHQSIRRTIYLRANDGRPTEKAFAAMSLIYLWYGNKPARRATMVGYETLRAGRHSGFEQSRSTRPIDWRAP